jgi:hypothetical protein
MTTVITIVLQEAGMAVPPARTQPPMVRASSRDALVYTVRDLDQKSARIMSQVEETREPAFITRDGRFVAIIKPLAPGQVESRVLAEISRRVSKRGRAAITQQHALHRFLARRQAGARRMRSPAPLRGLGERLRRHLSRRASAPDPRRLRYRPRRPARAGRGCRPG